jgi:osmoprotectant transport system substrate-binding protein
MGPGLPTRPRSWSPALGLLVAVVLGGCGAGAGAGSSSVTTHASAAGGRSPAAGRRSPAAGRRSAATSASASSASSTTSTTTTAALPGAGRPVVTIGDKNYTEQFVLGQLYQQALQYQGFRVNITQNIGPPAVVRNALLKTHSLAMYPEYLDDFDQTIADLHRPFHSERTADRAAERWAVRHGLRLLAPTPFSDTSAIAVTDAYAAAHRLSTIGGLRRVGATLVLGGAEPFQTIRSGLPALSDVYGVIPATFRAIAVGSQYGDLDTGVIQAAYVNTTDGELATGDYKVLGDPRRIFGFGNVVPVISAAVLAQEGPAFAETIDRVDRTLTLSTMRALNSEVDSTGATGATPASVATQYLQTHGLLSPLPAAVP